MARFLPNLNNFDLRQNLDPGLSTSDSGVAENLCNGAGEADGGAAG